MSAVLVATKSTNIKTQTELQEAHDHLQHTRGLVAACSHRHENIWTPVPALAKLLKLQQKTHRKQNSIKTAENAAEEECISAFPLHNWLVYPVSVQW